MKKLVYIFFVLLLVLPALMISAQVDVVAARVEAYGTNLPRGYGLLNAEDLVGLLSVQETVLLDVREPAEYEAGHLEDAFNVPLRTLGQNLSLLPDKTASIVVICKGGARASLAATSLQILGYENVKVLKAGYDGWVAAELPTTTVTYLPEPGIAPDFDPAVFTAVDTYLTNLPDGFALVSAPNLMAEVASDSPILIDVRSDEEWASGYIAGAQHIWIDEFVNRLGELPADKDAPIVIYCQSGYRGGIAAVMLNLLGYTNVRNLSGGLNSWTSAGLPLVSVPLDMGGLIETYATSLPDSFNGVSAADLSAELSSGTELLLVDVRTSDEYSEGFIEGAVNIPLNELTVRLDLLPNLDQNIMVYCGSGHRSAIAMTTLSLLGYSNVRSLLGGFGAWTAAQLPVSNDSVDYAAGTAPDVDPELFAKVDGFITGIPAGYYTVRALDLSSELFRTPPLLIDVRTDSEWAAGHIENAIHLPLTNFAELQSQLPGDLMAPIVVYDNPTHRSSMTMTFLRLLGYENVRALAGGIGAWEREGLPLS